MTEPTRDQFDAAAEAVGRPVSDPVELPPSTLLGVSQPDEPGPPEDLPDPPNRPDGLPASPGAGRPENPGGGPPGGGPPGGGPPGGGPPGGGPPDGGPPGGGRPDDPGRPAVTPTPPAPDGQPDEPPPGTVPITPKGKRA